MAAVEAIVPQTPSYEVEVLETKFVRGYQPLHAKDYSAIAIGSTAEIWPHSLRPGVVIKAPHSHEALLDPTLQNKYCTEAAILQSLGSHPRIVEYSLRMNPWSMLILKVFRTSRSTIAAEGLAPRRGS